MNVEQWLPARVRSSTESAAHALLPQCVRSAYRQREAVLDVRGEFEAGRMDWDDVKRVVAAFPKRGQLDTYLPGQEDEGAPEEAAAHVAAWDDADEPSADEDPASSASGAALAAPAEAAAEAEAHARKLQLELADLPVQELSKQAAVEAAALAAKLRGYDKLVADATELGNAHIARLLRDCRRRVEQEHRSMANPESGAIAAAAKRQRLGEQAQEASQRAKAARLRALAARTDQLGRNVAAAAKALRQQRAHFAAREAQRRRELACLEAPKGFDAADLGQGRANGGGPRHSALRRELLERVLARVGPLPADLQVNLERIWRLWDQYQAETHDVRWGSVFRDAMLRLLARSGADAQEALANYVRGWRRHVHEAEIVV